VQNLLIFKIYRIINLQNARCPIGRNELADEEWIYKGIIEDEEVEIMKEKRKAEG
jgi:hypothetical protein